MTINDNKKEDETKVIHIIRYARIKGYLVTELQIKHHHERILRFLQPCLEFCNLDHNKEFRFSC
ncbi:hypothetical protein P5673_016798 [Acropora cervicornis]|uniref:Uncharacterized protein n=1 Tax=Acropora cervicornis TaxID=6130 RepID=A0AAD9V459_ACRCE|nr:hypothetical protein P5673_016798 [Acropora cervicornis]